MSVAESGKVFLYRWFFSNLAGLTSADWCRLLRDNSSRVSPVYLPRAAFISLCAPGNDLQRMYENLRFGGITRQSKHEAPLFILGHWRSGTTYLHQLLTSDSRFASPSMVDVLFPHSVLSGGPMGTFMKWFLPKDRVVDRVKLGVSEPFEDEFALLLLTRLSPYLGWTFPRQEAKHEANWLLNNPDDAHRWIGALQEFVAKLYVKYGRPSLLKSPPHTARIRHLLGAFPDARFIHIHRHPVEVFASTCRLVGKGVDGLRLQRPVSTDPTEGVLRRYVTMYRRFQEDVSQIPAGRFVEIGYSQLIKRPLETLAGIYETLQLGAFADVRSAFETSLTDASRFIPNTHPAVEPQTVRRIIEDWKPYYSRWGYELEG